MPITTMLNSVTSGVRAKRCQRRPQAVQVVPEPGSHAAATLPWLKRDHARVQARGKRLVVGRDDDGDADLVERAKELADLGA